MILYRLSSLLNLFSKKTRKVSVDVEIGKRKMECEVTYEPSKCLLLINYIFRDKVCREIQIPQSTNKFADSIMNNFNTDLAKELYKYEIIC